MVEIYQTPDFNKAELIRISLNNNGIETYFKDEKTNQLFPHFSYAIGGIKIFVHTDDFNEASKVLEEEFGIIISSPDKVEGYESSFYSITKNLPFINKLSPQLQLVVLSVIITLVIGFLLFTYLIPTTVEKLKTTKWCIVEIINNNEKISSHTTGLKVMDGCSEKITFYGRNAINLPGFDSPSVTANWEFIGDSIRIFDATDLIEVYNGMFSLKIKPSGDLHLESKDLFIYCTPYL